MIRNVIFYLVMVCLTPWLCGLAVVLHRLTGKRVLVHRYIAVPWAKIMLLLSGVRVDARISKAIDIRKQYVFAKNHQSYFDILALLKYLPVPFAFVMKEELMEEPLLGKAMDSAGYIGISREDPRRAIHGMNKAKERAGEGYSLVIFPEGTRSIDGTLGDFKRGAFSLALKAGLDIVPVAISGAYKIVKKGRRFINKGRFYLTVLDPIPIKGTSKKDLKDLVDKVKEEIQGHL